MEPRNYALANLFAGYVVYVIPNYQRLYVWNREDQWEPLWSDVEDIANQLVKNAEQAQTDSIDADSVEPHFLGAVVLKMSGSTPDLASQLRVIDGQQRLTTLQILMGAAANKLLSYDLDQYANRLRDLTLNSSELDAFKIKHQRHRSGHDYEQFGEVMRAAISGVTSDHIGGPISECYQYFRRVIQDWFEGKDDKKLAGTALATSLIWKLNVVGIYLERHEKEHIIFETLNARGEPLTEWDKIKNYLLYKADESPNLRQDSFFETYLDRFDNSWWREFVGRGTQRPRMDVFVDYWLESRKRTPVSIRRVFREFRRFIDGRDSSIESLVQELVKDASYFKSFESIDVDNESREALFHRRRLNMSAERFGPYCCICKEHARIGMRKSAL